MERLFNPEHLCIGSVRDTAKSLPSGSCFWKLGELACVRRSSNGEVFAPSSDTFAYIGKFCFPVCVKAIGAGSKRFTRRRTSACAKMRAVSSEARTLCLQSGRDYNFVALKGSQF